MASWRWHHDGTVPWPPVRPQSTSISSSINSISAPGMGLLLSVSISITVTLRESFFSGNNFPLLIFLDVPWTYNSIYPPLSPGTGSAPVAPLLSKNKVSRRLLIVLLYVRTPRTSFSIFCSRSPVKRGSWWPQDNSELRLGLRSANDDSRLVEMNVTRNSF